MPNTTKSGGSIENSIAYEGRAMNTTFHSLTTHWRSIVPLVSAPNTDEEYRERLELLQQLIDEVGGDEQHPLASLLNFVGMLAADYEKAHYPPDASLQEVLALLMQEHQLRQTNLPERVLI
jgi:HTH-type transcriptional regulator/antitoxin HigA